MKTGSVSGKDQMNVWGKERRPFLFVLDYTLQEPLFFPFDEMDGSQVFFNINGFTNHDEKKWPPSNDVQFSKKPVPFTEYERAFNKVLRELEYGNSFLLNLTFSTPIECNLSLREIFERSKARYRLCLDDRFVCFSPETFVRIQRGRISSYPMKGTIDANIPGAQSWILNDPKETAEHITIVDLIRNDLSRVAEDVRVDRFRYVEEVRTHQKTLLQVSSEISGILPSGYHAHLGDIFYSMLPAGSITGAPKKKTVEILKEAETHDRGYFTGIVGYFDGMDVESGVMIRYIEKQNGKLIYKSGGGITTQSKAEDEYLEMVDKVYVPIING
jgi:para-aminobenzoate synthetase component 1